MSTTPQSSTTEQSQAYWKWRAYIHNRVTDHRDEASYNRSREIELDAAVAFVRACLAPASGEQPKGWMEECYVFPCNDPKRYGVSYRITTAEHERFLLPRGCWVDHREWWETSAPYDSFESESAARAALAQAPDPRIPPGHRVEAEARDYTLVSPVAPPAQTQGGDKPRPLTFPSGSVDIRCSTCGQGMVERQRLLARIHDLESEIARLRTPATPADADRVSVRRGDFDAIIHLLRSNGYDATANAFVTAALSSPASQPAPAASGPREGFTYPDEAVERVLTRIEAIGRMSSDLANPIVQPLVRSLIAATNDLTDARAPHDPAASGYDPAKVEALLEAIDWAGRNFAAPSEQRFDPVYTAARALRASRPATPPPADTPPATVPVPLELAREIKEARADGYVGNVLLNRVIDALAAGVKEAEHGK